MTNIDPLCQNKTKVGLKGEHEPPDLPVVTRQNKTKVGLKGEGQINTDMQPICQNKTKVGLKV